MIHPLRISNACRSAPEFSSHRRSAFTLVEVLVSTAVLVLLIVLIAQLFASATTVTTIGEKRMDSDAQARAVFDRMAIDFSRMLKRPDLDYVVKHSLDSANPDRAAQPQPGNDSLTFFSEVEGYYPPAGSQSPLSLVGYRFNEATVLLERLGKGLLWNGVSASDSPIVYLPLTIDEMWPVTVTQSDDPDGHFEPIGPQVFRFEYGYLLKGRKIADGTLLPAVTSSTPWDTRPGVAHTSAHGLQDVAAIIVNVAIVDPKSRALLSDDDLRGLAASNVMRDFVGLVEDPSSGKAAPGALETDWQAAIDSSALPLRARSSIRIYQKTIPISR